MKAALVNATLSSRLLAAVLAFELGKDMITTGLWMLQPESMTNRIARLSSAPELFAYLWMILALLVVPYFVLQVSGYGQELHGRITRLACWAILTSGVFWVYMGYISKNLDYGYITEIFLANGFTCLAMAATLAGGLNALLRQRQEGQA